MTKEIGIIIYNCFSMLSNPVLEMLESLEPDAGCSTLSKVQTVPLPEGEHEYPSATVQLTHPVKFPLSHYSPVCLILFPQTSGGGAYRQLED